MKITAKQLESLGASREQLDMLRALFGESIEVTEEACVAVADKFDWYCVVESLLSKEGQRVFHEMVTPARLACDEAIVAAWRAYREAMARAFARAANERAKTALTKRQL
jgi:hypothetical protein